jgi:alpha-tubulin suppressor-like RCC1 family protein
MIRRAGGALVVVLVVVLASCGRLGFEPLASDRDAGTDAAGPDADAGCAVRLGGGRLHMCAVLPGEKLACWGDGAFGQIGDGLMQDRPIPTVVPGLDDVIDVGGGRFETCVARGAGNALCWGEGDSGQLGDGASATTPTPVMVTGLADVVDVAPAAVHACALLASGAVWCWGSGANGRLGNGTTTSSPVPVQVGISEVTQLAAGGSTSCAIDASRVLQCWGLNLDGQVGDGTVIDAKDPVKPLGIGDVIAVSVRDQTTCAIRKLDGGVMCWGRNDLGNCGTGAASADLLQPTQTVFAVGGAVVGASEVAVGIDHACALIASSVFCWGGNANGQLGDGSVSSIRPSASPVLGLPPVTHIASTAYATCAVDTTGDVWCWGRGSDGELGDGTTVVRQPVPVMALAGCP